jgi:hypothetical protein
MRKDDIIYHTPEYNKKSYSKECITKSLHLRYQLTTKDAVVYMSKAMIEMVFTE